MNRLRELISDSLIYGISSVFARFVNYLLVPFHTDVFNPARFSIVGLVYAAIALLNVLFTMGMESAYIRYGKDRETASTLFRSLQLLLLSLASLLGGILWLAEPWALPLLNLDESVSGIYLMMIGILWFDTLSIVPFAELRLSRRTWLFASLKTVHVVLNLVLNFWLILGLGAGIEAVFLSNLIASVLVTLVVWTVTAPLFLEGEWNGPSAWRALRFGWPFVPAGIGYAMNETLDRFFLNAMDPERVIQLYGPEMTPEDITGIYNACYKLAVFMLLFIQMFRMAWQPFFMRYADDKDSPRLFAQAFHGFNLVAAPMFLFVSLFATELVQVRIPFLDATLIGSAYWAGLEIVPYLMLAYWFHGWYIHFSAGIFIAEKTRLLPLITLGGGGITILGNLALVPWMGMTGSAWATVLSYGAMALALWGYSQKHFRVPYAMGQGLLLMGGSIGVLALSPFAEAIVPLPSAAVRLILFLMAAIGLALYGWRWAVREKRDESQEFKA
ncbi:MAG: oligosaccharide flippase family protein [Bacteroidota bacterium]